jgi:ribosomal protein L11 methyltransferase
MKRGPLWKISVSTTAEAEDAVSESLAGVFNCPASIHTDSRTGRTTVCVYVDAKPGALPKLRDQLKRALVQLRTFGLAIGSGRIRVTEVRRENWAESWKRHFHPIEIGDALLLKPSWIQRQPRRGQAVVILDPGLSFGTGHHPTTRFCLEQLVRHRNEDARHGFLDIGTGSGILAISAVKLGYEPVHAFDFDPESVRVAQANAQTNGVAGQLRIARSDLTKLSTKAARQYDLVCANLISTLLIAECQRIAARTKPNGILVVAGILRAEFHLVQAAFESLGFRLVGSRREQEWASGAFRSAQA